MTVRMHGLFEAKFLVPQLTHTILKWADNELVKHTFKWLNLLIMDHLIEVNVHWMGRSHLILRYWTGTNS